MASTPNTEALVAGAKQWLADMDDDQFDALVAETREPADPEKKPTGSVEGGRERFKQGRGL